MRFLIVWVSNGEYVAADYPGVSGPIVRSTTSNPDEAMGFPSYGAAARWLRDRQCTVSAQGPAYIVLGPRVAALGA